LSPSGKGESLSDIVRRLKERVTKRLKYDHHISIEWQKGFHDHVLRPDERTEEVFQRIVNYIVQNPYRKGLAKEGDSWPFSEVREP
jgi:hypothetical protein